MTLYGLLRLRVDVFVVEQRSAYEELDGRDTEASTLHVWTEDGAGPAAYLRMLGEPGGGARIGRVCTRPDARGQGLASALLGEAVRRAYGRAVTLHAQTHLAGWYTREGFVVDGPGYVEDGIAHTPMRYAR
jgi:ElaA protein